MNDFIKIDTSLGKTEITTIDILELVNENDPILKQTMETFDFNNPPTDPTELSSLLVNTCKVKKGFGLASPQVGLPYRVFVMGSEEEYVAFFNPEIISSSKETTTIAEGCLSFPMLALKIERPSDIVVKYQDYTGKEHVVSFSGISSHCFQHELDHLNGVCYTTRAKKMSLMMGMKKRGKFNKLVDRYNKAQKKKEDALSFTQSI